LWKKVVRGQGSKRRKFIFTINDGGGLLYQNRLKRGGVRKQEFANLLFQGVWTRKLTRRMGGSRRGIQRKSKRGFRKREDMERRKKGDLLEREELNGSEGKNCFKQK